MSYFLNAILCKSQIQFQSNFTSLKVVHLEQGLTMVPLTDSLFDEITASTPEETHLVQGLERLSTSLAELLREVSDDISVAYVEAEYWGGVGSQSAVMWDKGEVVFQVLNSQDAINQVLRMLGIEAKDAVDEFDSVNLGRYRFTNDW